MTTFTLYGTECCPYCLSAEKLLQSRGAKIDKILIDKEPHQRNAMETRSGRRSVPQIFLENQHIGGFDDLSALDKSGQLSVMLNSRA